MQIRAKWREKRKVRRQRGGRGAGTLAGEPSASGRVPKRTHRVVQRIGKVHERVDRVLQSSLGQTRVSREKATDATLSKSTRKRDTSSRQEPGRSREEWPVPAGTAKQRLHKRRPRGVRDTARAFRYRATWSAWRLCAGDGGACRERADQLQRHRPAG